MLILLKFLVVLLHLCVRNSTCHPESTLQTECSAKKIKDSTPPAFTLYLSGPGGLDENVLTAVVGAKTFVKNVRPALGRRNKANGSAQFVDDDSYIYISPSDMVNPSCGFTISALVWFESDSGPIIEFVPMNDERGFHIFLVRKKLVVNYDNRMSGYVKSAILTMTKWIKIVVIADRTTPNAILWVDGVHMGSKNFGALPWFYGGLRIGGRGGKGENRYLRGRIFCLQFYDYAMPNETSSVSKLFTRCNASSTQTLHHDDDDACAKAKVGLVSACQSLKRKRLKRLFAVLKSGHRMRNVLKRAAWGEGDVDASIFTRESLDNLFSVDKSMVRTLVISVLTILAVYLLECLVQFCVFLWRRRRSSGNTLDESHRIVFLSTDAGDVDVTDVDDQDIFDQLKHNMRRHPRGLRQE